MTTLHTIQQLLAGELSLPIDTLDPTRGNHDDEPKGECSLLCYSAEQDLEAAE